MKDFLETSHLSEILEYSKIEPVLVFKYSNSCASSEKLKKDLEESNNKLSIYLLTVQTQKVLSKKIEEYTGIKHESPQIVIFKNCEAVFSASHEEINVNDLLGFKL